MIKLFWETLQEISTLMTCLTFVSKFTSETSSLSDVTATFQTVLGTRNGTVLSVVAWGGATC